MKIKLESDDDVPLNKSLKFNLMTITIRSVFFFFFKLYPQVYLHDTLYELNIQKMLEYDKIDISEGIDVNKTNVLRESNICHYWYFKDVGLQYENYLCNGIISLKEVKGSAYRINFWYMSKDNAINIMNGSNLIDKRGVL